MSRLSVVETGKMRAAGEALRQQFAQRIAANPVGVCAVEQQLAFLKVCHAQSCGKCVPCRIGLGHLEELLESVLDNKATMDTLKMIRDTAENIRCSADCAIGFEAANMVLKGLDGFEEDYLSHIQNHRCHGDFEQPIPCVTLCPAHVDVPGYIALCAAGRYDDALRLIRKDNPFPVACALICEHPCEKRCRRKMIDDAVNIRGLKRYVVDNCSGHLDPPTCGPSTGKRVAVVGSGPSGLTAAYFLQIMGHQCTVFEEKDKLGGMLRYGIPNYRFPRERLDEDIRAILTAGMEVKTNTKIGTEEIIQLRKDYDAVYVAIGAHADKKLHLEGEDSGNVFSAVEVLRNIGDGNYPDYTGKSVIVVGGGNVAMDCARTAVRAGAEQVGIVYRRRQEDMTALPSEVEAAMAEGVELLTLKAPVRIEADENGDVAALWVQPQIIGLVKNGRPAPRNANKPEERFACDIILVAVGQDIVSAPFGEAGFPLNRNRIIATEDGAVGSLEGVFAGGECVLGAATVIRAIEGGKVAAANIDEYLGFSHPVSDDIEIPEPLLNDKVAAGRVNLHEVEAYARKQTFDGVELPMSDEEAFREASRCLRCDKHGCGNLRGGRRELW